MQGRTGSTYENYKQGHLETETVTKISVAVFPGFYLLQEICNAKISTFTVFLLAVNGYDTIPVQMIELHWVVDNKHDCSSDFFPKFSIQLPNLVLQIYQIEVPIRGGGGSTQVWFW